MSLTSSFLNFIVVPYANGTTVSLFILEEDQVLIGVYFGNDETTLMLVIVCFALIQVANLVYVSSHCPYQVLPNVNRHRESEERSQAVKDRFPERAQVVRASCLTASRP